MELKLIFFRLFEQGKHTVWSVWTFDTCVNNGSPWRSGWKMLKETCSFQCSIGNHILLAWGLFNLRLGLKGPRTDSPKFFWLVVYLPLWKIWKSVGSNYCSQHMEKNPNRQPVFIIVFYFHYNKLLQVSFNFPDQQQFVRWSKMLGEFYSLKTNGLKIWAYVESRESANLRGTLQT